MRSSASLDARPHTPLSLCAGPRDHLQSADEASILARWTLSKMSRPERAAPTGWGTGAAFGLNALSGFAGPQTLGIDAAGAACDPLGSAGRSAPTRAIAACGAPASLEVAGW